MAAINAAGKSAIHATLAATVVDTVTFGPARRVEVINVDGAAAIYFTVDGAVPTVAGDDTQVLPAAISGMEVDSPGSGPAVVRLISSGTPKYSVRIVS